MVAQFSSNSFVNKNTLQPQPLTPQPPRQNTIDWLLTLGLPPLPVAPAQDPHLYPLRDKKGVIQYEKDRITPKPKFTGKNPSYLDENDIPHTVTHGKYQKRQPTKEELDTWFANPRNGVGSLGSDKWAFVDLDRHKFDAPELTPEQSQDACDEAGKRIIDAAEAETQKLPPYEKTQSGGWRVVVGLSKPPTFTNFCLTPGGVHVGEVLGKGRFAVLAPSIGPSGNVYVAYHRCPPDEIPVIDELEKLTLHPVKASRGRPKNATSTPNDSQPALTPVSDSSTPDVDGSTPNVDGSTPNVDGSTPNVDASSSNSTSHATQILEKYPQLRDKVFDLRDLGTDTTRDVLAGVDEKNDRSASLTTAIRDWYGWENWCSANGITYRGDTRSLAVEAADKLKIEDHEDRVDRILKGIDGNSCVTSCEYKGGDDEGCWKRVVKLAGVKGSKRFFTSVFPDKPLPSPLNANAKVIPLPTATPLPKAVGGGDNSPPLPQNYGGGSGGNDPNDDVDWSAPVAYKGNLGYWVQPKKDDPPHFFPKCNFDFVIDRHFIRHQSAQGKVSTPDGGGFRLKVTLAEERTSKYVYVTGQDFGKADKFAEALKAGLGDSVSFKLSSHELQSLHTVKVQEYRKRGGKKYRICDHIGQQVDGTWVFPDAQFNANGKRLDPEETEWVFNPYVGGLDHIPCPLIPNEDNPNALRNLLTAQREFAAEGFMPFFLTTGFVAASLHDQAIVKKEGYFPILNLCGDPGGGKTVATKAATSVIRGAEQSGMAASLTLSRAYERLSKQGSVVCVIDDPPSQSVPEKRQLDEFIKSVYNRFAREVRQNIQEPRSALIITSNDAKGQTSDAAKSRLIRLYIGVKDRDGLGKAYANLYDAMEEAPGAFRSLLTIGYDADAISETHSRLKKHMRGAMGRSVNNLAILTWYTKRVVELAGLEDVDVEGWVISNLCPQMVEELGSVNSATDFVERILALKAESYVGNWNLTRLTHRKLGEVIALNMPSLWKLVERSANHPTYDRSVLEKVLVDMGCVKNQQAKFDENRDISLAYEREIRKGVNKGEGWVPPKPPDKVNLRALVIPQRLWGTLGFDPPDSDPNPPTSPNSDPNPPTPPNPDSPPPATPPTNPTGWDAWDAIDDGWGGSHSQVADLTCQVAESSKGYATRSNLDVVSALDLSKTQSSKVAEKKEKKLEREELDVELIDASEKIQDTSDAQAQNDGVKTSTLSSKKSATLLLSSKETPETPDPQGIDEVADPCYFDATSGGNLATSATLAKTDAQDSALTPDDNLIKLGAVAHEMIQCDTPADVEKIYAQFPQELINAAKKDLGDDELLTFEAIASQCANPSPAAAEVAQELTPDPTPKVEVLTPAAQDNKDASPSDAKLLADAKRQGKEVFRYVGEMRTWGVNSLAHNVLVERLGEDRFGLLLSVQRLGEKWAQPIDVCPKLLEEV